MVVVLLVAGLGVALYGDRLPFVGAERAYGEAWWEVRTNFVDGSYNVFESPKGIFKAISVAPPSYCAEGKEIRDIRFILRTNLADPPDTGSITFSVDAYDGNGDWIPIIGVGEMDLDSFSGQFKITQGDLQGTLGARGASSPYLEAQGRMDIVVSGESYRAEIPKFKHYLSDCSSETATTTDGFTTTTTTRTTTRTSTTTTSTTTTTTTVPPSRYPCWWPGEPAITGTYVDVSCDNLGIDKPYDVTPAVQCADCAYPKGYLYKGENIREFLNAHPEAGRYPSTAGGTIPAGYQVTWSPP